MQRFLKPLATLVTLLLIGGGAGLLLRSDKAGTYTVTAYFEKAIGLFANSDVDVLGVPVGNVTAVEPQGPNVKVTMEISDEYKIPVDAFAQIVPISVIADRFIQLHPPYTGGEAMQDGTVLREDRTQIPAELDDVFKQLKKLLEAIEPGVEGEPGALGNLVVALNDALADREQDLRGTIESTASLTGTLSDAQGDLDDLLVNLDDLFGKLAPRATSISSLNGNMAIVLTMLADSRSDLEGTLANLAAMTGEVGRIVEKHRGRLGEDLELAGNVLSKLLENRASVEESLQWLPVVAEGLGNAFHGGENQDVDVRDNALAKVNCDALEDLPDSPIKDILIEQCRAQTGEPRAAEDTQEDETIGCRRGVRQVKRQLNRLGEVELPTTVMAEIVDPLEKKLRKLAKKCEQLRKAITEPGSLEELINEVPGLIPDLDDEIEDLGNLTGNAAGGAVTGTETPSVFDRLGGWFGGFFGFLGWSS